MFWCRYIMYWWGVLITTVKAPSDALTRLKWSWRIHTWAYSGACYVHHCGSISIWHCLLWFQQDFIYLDACPSCSSHLVVMWTFNDDDCPELNIGNMTITDCRRVFVLFRQNYHDYESAELEKARHQGKTFPCFSRSRAFTTSTVKGHINLFIYLFSIII